jgi:hypothetical protein
VPDPPEKALRDLRRRLGPAPLKALFEVVAGPLAQPRTPGVQFGGLRTVAFDRLNSVKVPGTGRNRSWIGKIRYRQGLAGYPVLRLMTLAETGTRACSARRWAARPAGTRPAWPGGCCPCCARACWSCWTGPLMPARSCEVAATGAMLLARATSTRCPPVTEHLPDGSYLSDLDGLPVRIIEADLAVTGSDGSRIQDTYLLITTLTDYRRYPAAALVRPCHERWEIESAYLALRHTLLGGHVLRSGDRPGVEQEVWAMLTLYQLLRMAMVTAIGTRPGTDPDRASFTTALEAARDQLTTVQGICPSGPADLPGAIGRAVLGTLLPPRRRRYSARNVKCPISRYHARVDGRPALPAVITAIDITICTPPLDTGDRQRRSHRGRIPPLLGPHRPTRRDKITALITSQPQRDWSGHELAVLLGVKPRNMLTQLGEWSRLGIFTRTGSGTYRLNTPAADTSSTPAPDP